MSCQSIVSEVMVEQFLANRLIVVTLGAVLALLLIAWIAARVQTARRSRALVVALDDSTRGRVTLQRGPGAAGLAGVIEPAPDPYVSLAVNYRAASALDPVTWLGRLAQRPGDRLVFEGWLPAHPAAELVWQEGRIPAYATARRARSTLWVPRRADVVNAEYAVRGVDTGAIEHVFVDLQARFRPFLQEVIVLAEQEPEVRVVLRLAGLNLQEIPPLVASLRMLGRAALRR
jgi:hypothetical protein